jgi:hypothetical protein
MSREPIRWTENGRIMGQILGGTAAALAFYLAIIAAAAVGSLL